MIFFLTKKNIQNIIGFALPPIWKKGIIILFHKNPRFSDHFCPWCIWDYTMLVVVVVYI